MELDSKILVLGSSGLAGSAIVRNLKTSGYTNVIESPRSNECNLTRQEDVHKLFLKVQPQYIFLCAAKVGGILINKQYPASFGYENGMISLNVIYNSLFFSVKKMLFLGSSCIYPMNAPQPVKEEFLLTSELESSNEMYALSKIFGLKLCQAFNKQYKTNFISCMPCNLYGPKDNYNLDSSHVFPALIKKLHIAKLSGIPLEVWGDGTVYREFLHTDDMASAAVFLMNNYNESSTINVGTGKDITIKNLVELMAKIIGYDKEIIWDKTKPNGTFRKCLDITKMNNLGWTSKIDLETGIKMTYETFLKEEKL